MNESIDRNKKLLSVIIPVYNVEKYLQRCVKSIMSQNNNNLEVILIDDGSTDNSGTLCEELSSRYGTNIITIHKENGGLSSARNTGLKIASGKYIFFLDSDDCVSEFFMKILQPELESENFDIVEIGCYWERVYNSFSPINRGKKYELSSKECIENILKNKIGNQISLRICKKELFENIIFPEGRNYEDISTCYRLLMRAKRILYIESNIYIYNITNANSITKSVSLKNMMDMYNSVNELCEGVRGFCLEKEIDLDYIEYYRRHSYIYIYIKLFLNGHNSSELMMILKKYLGAHNRYNLIKYRRYDLKRWLYYECLHLLGKM